MGKHATSTEPATPGLSLWQWILVVFLVLWTIFTAIGVVRLWPGGQEPNIAPEYFTSFSLNHSQYKATVIHTDTGACQSAETGAVFDSSPRYLPGVDDSCTWFIVEINEGDDAGKRTLLINSSQPGEPMLEKNDRILLFKSDDPQQPTLYTFGDYQRSAPLTAWALLIALAIGVFALLRGIRALVGLGVTLVMILVFTIPILLQGASPISAAVISGALILLIVVPLVHGFNWKSASALGGTLLALAIAAWLASIAIGNNHLRGLGDEDNLHVILYLPDVSVEGLMLCGFIIGALGVLNDVAISQSSTVNELSNLDPDADPIEIFLSAMKVGRDHISSMVYTLVLTYTGASLPLLLLLSVSGRPWSQILTSDIMATEVLRSGIGALALTLAVPITTLIAAYTVHGQRPATYHGGRPSY